VLGYDAIDTGLAFLPLTFSIAAMSMGISTKLVDALARSGRWPRLAGSSWVCCCWPETACTRATSQGCSSHFLALGLGAGASFLPLADDGHVRHAGARRGPGSGIINVSVQLFGAIGLASLGTIATDHTNSLTAAGHSLASALTGGYSPCLPGRRNRCRHRRGRVLPGAASTGRGGAGGRRGGRAAG